MEWYEDPVHTRDEVRAAAWRGAGRMLLILLVVGGLMAVLFPAFFQNKGGPKLGPSSVASAIQAYRRETGRWPTAFREIAPRLWNDHLRRHQVGLVSIRKSKTEAEYAVSVDRSLQVFRLTSNGEVARIGKASFGTFPK